MAAAAIVVRGVDIVVAAVEAVVFPVDAAPVPELSEVASEAGDTGAPEGSSSWTLSAGVVHPVCTLTMVAVVVRVAGTTFPPVEVEYVSTTTVVMVTALVVTSVVVTGAEVHHVSTMVFVTVTSVEHGSELPSVKSEPVAAIIDETKEDATDRPDESPWAVVDAGRERDAAEPRDEATDEDEDAAEMEMDGEKCHELASWTPPLVVVVSYIVRQDTVIGGG